MAATLLILALCATIPRFAMRAQPPLPDVSVSDAARAKILTYIRERFALPDTEKLSLGALHPSATFPGFDEATVTVDDGKRQGLQPVLISRDVHYLIVLRQNGTIDLHSSSTTEMAQLFRAAFKVPADAKVWVGGFKRSPSPDFQVGTVSVQEGSKKQEQPVLLSQDGKHLILSDMYNLDVDLREQALHTISLHDEPSIGPANAPVTIVEYADLECPTCARMNDFLATQIVPRYGNKVRIVFKEFPLVAVHDWSLTAAIACQCAYEMNPASYLPLRTAIFRNQQMINIANLRDTLLNFGQQAGLDRVQLAGCIDAKSSLPRVERDMEEAKRLNIDRVPTLYINGRMLIGLPSEEAYLETIDAALRGSK